MSVTLSERATASIKRPAKARAYRCPACDYEWHDNGKPRSLEQHRRFFGIVRAAFQHWPDQHEQTFSTEDECRAWLIMKAGWRETVLRMPMQGVKPDLAALIATTALRSAGSNAVAVAHKGQLCVLKPKSVKWSSMKHMEFVALNQAVEDVIKDVFGITGDELLEQSKGNI